MRVAVITPYYKEKKRVLWRNIRSVLNQTYGDVVHILVSDGYPQDWVNDFTLHHIVLPNVGNYGDTPRGIGAAYAAGLDVDAVMFLDADCWLEHDHVERMVAVARSGAGVVTCPRMVHVGGETGICTESNGISFNDTNCFLVTKPYFSTFAAWMFKNQKDCIVGDRVYWNAVLHSRACILRCDSCVNYDSDFVHHYQMFGLEVPPNAKIIVGNEVKKWRDVC